MSLLNLFLIPYTDSWLKKLQGFVFLNTVYVLTSVFSSAMLISRAISCSLIALLVLGVILCIGAAKDCGI